MMARMVWPEISRTSNEPRCTAVTTPLMQKLCGGGLIPGHSFFTLWSQRIRHGRLAADDPTRAIRGGISKFAPELARGLVTQAHHRAFLAV